MVDKLDHFGHGPHYLFLHASNAVDPEGKRLQCAICWKSTNLTSDHVYACPPCRYFLDPLCAKQLEEKTYLICHEEHMSTLITSPPPWPPASPLPACKACSDVIAAAVPRYSCNTCSYITHPRCSQWPRTAKVEEHLHLLCLVFPRGRNQSFNCARCGFSDGGFWGYHCRECPPGRYFMHLDCNAFQPRPTARNQGRICLPLFKDTLSSYAWKHIESHIVQPRPTARNQGGAAGATNADVAALQTRVNSLEMQLQGGKARAIVSDVLLGINLVTAPDRLVTTVSDLRDYVSSSGGDNTRYVGDQAIQSSAGDTTTDVGDGAIDQVQGAVASVFSWFTG